MTREPARSEPSKDTPPPIGPRDIGAVFAVLVLFLASQALALLLIRPFAESGVKGFENPEDARNGLWLLASVVVFTVLILWVAARKWHWVTRAVILASFGLTLVYVFFPLLDLIPDPLFDWQDVAVGAFVVPVNLALLLALPPAILLTWLIVRFPEWYVVDLFGVAVSAGAITLFGNSFTPVTYLVVLVLFAAYDYVSVYRTKHMLALADTVLGQHLPIMFVVPRTLDYSFLDETGHAREAAARTRKKKARDALFIGLGDVVIPSIFAVTALQRGVGAAAGAFVGIAIGLVVLLAFVLRGRPHAGLPTLNGGAFLGFLVGFGLDKGTLVFW